jgi:hypothetical protein
MAFNIPARDRMTVAGLKAEEIELDLRRNGGYAAG